MGRALFRAPFSSSAAADSPVCLFLIPFFPLFFPGVLAFSKQLRGCCASCSLTLCGVTVQAEFAQTVPDRNPMAASVYDIIALSTAVIGYTIGFSKLLAI